MCMRLHKRERNNCEPLKIEWLTSNEVLSDPDHIQAGSLYRWGKMMKTNLAVVEQPLHTIIILMFHFNCTYTLTLPSLLFFFFSSFLLLWALLVVVVWFVQRCWSTWKKNEDHFKCNHIIKQQRWRWCWIKLK